jgi:hypothetical protein
MEIDSLSEQEIFRDRALREAKVHPGPLWALGRMLEMEGILADIMQYDLADILPSKLICRAKKAINE